MTLKPVKCKYCSLLIDRNSEEFVKVSNRYAHANCHEKQQDEAEQFKNLTDFIKSLYRGATPNWKLIGTQIKQYRKDDMTYYGMLHTLEYFFIIKKNDIHKSAGVGIIPFQYEEAKRFYEYSNHALAKAAKIRKGDVDLSTHEETEVYISSSPVSKSKTIDYEY